MIKNLAVIGLGSMGIGIAQSLLRAGWNVRGCDLRTEARAAFEALGGQSFSAPKEAAHNCAVVVCVVVNAAQTEALLFGPDGIAPNLPSGTLILSCATMAPSAASALAEKAEALSVLFLDAPISGGAARAAKGELTVIASGSPEAFLQAEPVLEAVAAKVFRIGDKPGQGAAMKMVNQLLAGVHIAAAGEAMVMAARLGLELPAVYEVITASAGNSWMFENRMPHVVAGDYTPLSTIEIFVKDLGIINDIARDMRFSSPISAAALQIYLGAAGMGLGSEDDAAVAKVYAQLSGVTLPTK